MLKAIVPFYIVCFALYVLFSRQPDFQDGEITDGVIHFVQDSSQKKVAEIFFLVGGTKYAANAEYPLRKLEENQPVKVIYETNDPSKAAVFQWWGYWIEWDELLASILIPFILLYAAKAITAGPTPEALVEEMEMKNPPKRRKYD